jgi:DNA-binding CsgD family transcriptional regulator
MVSERAELVGRGADCATLRAALGSDAATPVALLLTGEAGIGKTALWEWATRHAAEHGQRVLISRAAAAEAKLPWVGLTDLLGGVPGEVLGLLPEPQRRALQAVALEAGSSGQIDERAVYTAFLSAVTAVARTGPVLLAVDDLPYLDAASAAALAFTLRRAGRAHPVRLLATVRGADVTRGTGPDPARAMGLDLAHDQVQRLPVGPLTLGELFELLTSRVGARLPRPLLLRVHETSGGNPLYALELARALDRLEIRAQPGGPLPVPTGLTSLVNARIRELPEDVRAVVAATAAAWRVTADSQDPAAVEAALRADLIIAGEPVPDGPPVIRAAHPLLSAAAYESLPAARRRALHERLARLTTDPVERARHLALAAAAPRASIAQALDDGVRAALASGVPHIAVELAQLSLEHTPDPAQRPERLDLLADARLRAGDSSGARAAQEAAVELTGPGPARARRKIRLAEIAVEVTGLADAHHILESAQQDAVADPAMLAEVLLTIAAIVDDINLADASAQRAVALLDDLAEPDPVILSGALAQAAGARFRAGRGLDHAMFERAIEIERRHPYRRISDRADANYAALLKYADDLDGAQARLLELLAQARETADLSSITYTLSHLAHIALFRGEIEQGRRYADEHLEVAIAGQQATQRHQALNNLGLALACQGQLDEAAGVLTDLIAGPEVGDWSRQRALGTLGFVALSRGEPEAAAGHLDQWHAALTAMHFGEPGYSRYHLDYLCALVGVGRIADATTFRSEVQEQARRSGRASAAAVALAGQALISASEGQADRANEALAEALAWYDTSPLRFDRARVLLIGGQIRRRAKAKSAARELLAAALAEFTRFGARAWAAQAATELARVNVRPSAPAALTETERRVAELAAAGLTNREVAARTFLATKTVEANLARVYRKLGIRSRAELGARLGNLPGP